MEKPERLKAKPHPSLEYSAITEEIEREREKLANTRISLEKTLEHMGVSVAFGDRLMKEWADGNIKIDERMQGALDELADAYKEAQDVAQKLSTEYDEIYERIRSLRAQDMREDIEAARIFEQSDKTKMS